ncbi:LysR family transcriptional regulator [Bacillus licheniformis]|nr:LysR family transcriptional regulator [Bacillus licheniformis]
MQKSKFHETAELLLMSQPSVSMHIKILKRIPDEII